MKELLKILFLGIIFVPTSTFAFSMQTAPDISVNNESIIDENLYLLGGNVNFNKTFDEDLITVAGRSFISGAVFGDILSISGDAFFSGEAFGDTRIVGNKVVITGNTNKDLIAIGSQVSTEETAILNGKTLIVAGEVYLHGQVLDDLKIVAGKVNINAEILGDVEITAQRVSIGPKAQINGDFVYFSPKRADVSSDAKIKQRFVYNQTETLQENSFVKRAVVNFVTFWSVIKFLATLFTAFILIFVFRMFSQRTSFLATKKMGKSILVGLFSIVFIPIISAVLFASLFGMPIAIILFLLYLIAVLLTGPVSGIVLGYYIQKLNKKVKKKEVDFNSTALAIILLTFLYFIPIVGSILRAFFVILSFGAMVLYYFEIVTIKKVR